MKLFKMISKDPMFCFVENDRISVIRVPMSQYELTHRKVNWIKID